MYADRIFFIFLLNLLRCSTMFDVLSRFRCFLPYEDCSILQLRVGFWFHVVPL